MTGTLLGAIATSPWMRAALRYGATVLAVILFLLGSGPIDFRIGA